MVVEPSHFDRLKVLCEAYQRIRYKRLTFRIVPMAPSVIAGGYTAGFIRDCKDRLSGDVTSALLASGGVSKKNYDDSIVVVTGIPDLYYTSVEHVGSISRWSSPGSFVISVDSPADKDMDVLVYMDWHVELSEPVGKIVDTHKESGTVTIDGMLLMINKQSEIYYTTTDEQTVSALTSAVIFGRDMPPKTKIRFLSPRAYSEITSSGGVDHIINTFGIICKDDGKKWAPLLATGAEGTDHCYGTTFLTQKGETFIVEIPENSTEGFLFLSMQSKRPSYQIALKNLAEEQRPLEGYYQSYPRLTSHQPNPVYMTTSQPVKDTSGTLETFSALISKMLCPVVPLCQSSARLTEYQRRLRALLSEIIPQVEEGKIDEMELQDIFQRTFEEIPLNVESACPSDVESCSSVEVLPMPKSKRKSERGSK